MCQSVGKEGITIRGTAVLEVGVIDSYYLQFILSHWLHCMTVLIM